MNTRNIAAEYRLAHWAGIMNERKESGLSIRAFCENVGIHENTYFHWQKRLREAACRDLHGTSLISTGFTEVKLAERSVLYPPMTDAQKQVSIEASGIRITAGIEYPVEKLAVLLREVARSC